MFLFCRYYIDRTCFIFLLFSLQLLSAVECSESPTKSTVYVHPNNTWQGFTRFLHAGKGSRVAGLAELKRYFSRFGYLPPETHRFSDLFDEELKKAVILYQRNLGLSVTGRLDHETTRAIISPRCGVRDLDKQRLKAPRRYAYFIGEPMWNRPKPITLRYAISSVNTIDYLSQSDIRVTIRKAFAAWSAAIPMNFTETEDEECADIQIAWYSGDHGDGEPFDGALGILAHAFEPESGMLHLDTAERWAIDFSADRSKHAVDLESVATHEIGHLLGLAHSSVRESIMYPSLGPRTKKLDLRKDDVEGIQGLYGSNPNYRYNPRIQSDVSFAWAMNLDQNTALLNFTVPMLLLAMVTLLCQFW